MGAGVHAEAGAFEDCPVAGSALVGRASFDDPLGGLAGDLGDELKVSVVVQYDKASTLGDGSDESVDQRDRSVEPPVHKALLDVQRTPEVALGGRRSLEGTEPGRGRVVVGGGAGTEAQFVDDRGTQCDLAGCYPGGG